MVSEKPIVVPVYFSKGSQFFPEPLIVLAGDVGATKTNLALYKFWQSDISILQTEQYHSGDFTDIILILREFLKGGVRPDRISLGVAGPVLNEKAVITNLPWEIDAEIIRKKTNVQEVILINDLEATAYGLGGLKATDISTIHKGDKNIRGNICVIAPGTGLGEAGLYFDGQYYHPFATEGGHTTFSPGTETDIELYYYLGKKYGHVSWEKLISGPGILHIYQFLRDIKKREEPHWLTAKLTHGDEAAVISQFAAGKQCVICNETMNIFFRYLAEECANLVLKLKATGGIYIGGGIAPRTRHLINHKEFIGNFLNKGRMKNLLEKVAVRIILNDRTALKGAAFYGAYA